MPFDPLSWAFGWSAGKVGDTLLRWLIPSELSSRLNATIRDWAKTLPPERHAAPEAIFQRNEPHSGPAGRLLSERLADSVLPTEEEWHRALVERWHALRAAGGPLQPFFEAPSEQASVDLRSLSRRLHDVCSSDEKMYRYATGSLARTARELENKSPVMMVNAVEEPQAWNSTYKLRFHLHNPTRQSLLLSSLGVRVASILEIDRIAVKKPGAPLVEHEFAVVLPDRPEWTPLVARGPARFYLKPGETEFFLAEVGARPGREYLASLTAQLSNLETGATDEISAPALWLPFEGST